MTVVTISLYSFVNFLTPIFLVCYTWICHTLNCSPRFCNCVAVMIAVLKTKRGRSLILCTISDTTKMFSWSIFLVLHIFIGDEDVFYRRVTHHLLTKNLRWRWRQILSYYGMPTVLFSYWHGMSPINIMTHDSYWVVDTLQLCPVDHLCNSISSSSRGCWKRDNPRGSSPPPIPSKFHHYGQIVSRIGLP